MLTVAELTAKPTYPKVVDYTAIKDQSTFRVTAGVLKLIGLGW